MSDAGESKANNNISDAMTEHPPPQRRKRYARSPEPSVLMALTPDKVRLLEFLAECRFLSLPQLARLARPLDKNVVASQKSVRRHLRALFDAGLVDVLAVSRPALAPPDAANVASLLYGSAPNVYVPTRPGLEMLARAGRLEPASARRTLPSYGPMNSLFLAHELMVRDIRVWLEWLAATSESGAVLQWTDGPDAAIDLLPAPPSRQARPDAWFVYRVRVDAAGKEVVLVGLVEADRGTERGVARWSEKVAAYRLLLEGERLRETTGYRNARVLVVTPDAARRERLAGQIEKEARDEELAAKFWLAQARDLEGADLIRSVWQRPGFDGLEALVT